MPINVRWRPDVTAPQRAMLEDRFHLASGQLREGTTWSYELTDQSISNIHALVRNPAVDDTASINRRLFRPPLAYDRAAHIAFGALIAGAVGVLLVLGRSRGPVTIRSVLLDETTLIRLAGIAPAALIVVSVVLVLMAVVRYEPLWASSDASLAEAAHDGDIAAVFRMVSAGADPNRAEPVPFEHRAQPVVLTPLEAGVESRQPEVLQVLVNAGARAEEPQRQRLACLAAAIGASEITGYLRSALPPMAEPDCSRMALPEY